MRYSSVAQVMLALSVFLFFVGCSSSNTDEDDQPTFDDPGSTPAESGVDGDPGDSGSGITDSDQLVRSCLYNTSLSNCQTFTRLSDESDRQYAVVGRFVEGYGIEICSRAGFGDDVLFQDSGQAIGDGTVAEGDPIGACGISYFQSAGPDSSNSDQGVDFSTELNGSTVPDNPDSSGGGRPQTQEGGDFETTPAINQCLEVQGDRLANICSQTINATWCAVPVGCDFDRVQSLQIQPGESRSISARDGVTGVRAFACPLGFHVINWMPSREASAICRTL